ncbi:MAG: hypothetical protein Q9174_003326 [Haloplaca sp. 1 TL-2023]
MLDEKDVRRIGREEIDTVLGDFEAATDVPGFLMSEEFLNAYPDAKIILNQRKDVAAWQRSFQNTICGVLRDNYKLKVLAWLSADYFWLRQISLRLTHDFWAGDFEQHGTAVYEAYYRDLEERLGGRGSGRYVVWGVEDGW